MTNLWDEAAAFPAIERIPLLNQVTHVMVHRACAGEYQFLHEASLAWHKGVLYAAWANDPVGELSPEGTCRGRRSRDGGLTWSAPEVIAPPLPGVQRHNHGELFSDGTALYAFVARYGDGEGRLFPGVVTELFVLDESTEEWVCRGVAARGFWAFSKPVRVPGGGWAMAGVDKDTYPVVAVSDGDLSRWETISIPAPEGLIFVEPALLPVRDGLLAVMRYQYTSDERTRATPRVALVSSSRDGGRTWTMATESNLPMDTSKVYAGVLSTGQRYLVANVGNRDTLFIAVGRPGEDHLSRVWSIRHGRSPEPRAAGWCKGPQWSYPCAVEHDGNLYVAYSVGKEDCALSIIPLTALAQ